MTILTDSFPGGVPQLTWTLAQGPAAWNGNAAGNMRTGTGVITVSQIMMSCSSTLATNDMAVSCLVSAATTAPNPVSSQNGPCARLTASTCYEAAVQCNDTQASILLRRVVGGSRATLQTFMNLGPWDTTAHKVTLRVTGTNPVRCEVLKDDVSLGVFSDTDATRVQTGNHAGISMHNGYNGSLVGIVDNFSAADYVYVPVTKEMAGKANIASSAKQGVVLQFR